MRILVELPDAHLQSLAALSQRKKQPRAALIRAAVADYLERHKSGPVDAAFGLWGRDGTDSVDIQRELRDEW